MLSEEELVALKAQHGRIKYVVYNGVDLVFRKPKRAECQAYMMKREDGGSAKVAADEQLAQQIVVRCGDETDALKCRQAFLALLEEYPLLVNERSVGGAIGQLAGITQDDDLKNVGSTSKTSGAPQTTTQSG